MVYLISKLHSEKSFKGGTWITRSGTCGTAVWAPEFWTKDIYAPVACSKNLGAGLSPETSTSQWATTLGRFFNMLVVHHIALMFLSLVLSRGFRSPEWYKPSWISITQGLTSLRADHTIHIYGPIKCVTSSTYTWSFYKEIHLPSKMSQPNKPVKRLFPWYNFNYSLQILFFVWQRVYLVY